MDSLLKSSEEFSKDVAMKFGISKCAAIAIKAGKIVENDEIQLNCEGLIKAAVLQEGYKYLGVLEASDLL